MGFGMTMGGMFMGWIYIALIIVGIIFLVKFVSGTRDSKPDNNNISSIEILKERYAKGEIDRDEFLKIKNDLDKN